MVEIWTDGSYYKRQGIGGAGAVLRYGEHEKELFMGIRDTSPTRAELQAILMALQALKRPCQVKLYSDSKVALRRLREMLAGERLKTGNQAVIRIVEAINKVIAAGEHELVGLRWVKSHTGEHILNSRADYLAKQGTRRMIKRLGLWN